MKIFISWSGQRSKAVAEALRDWLVRVIQRLEPWVSSEDIRAGARWQIEIAGVLSNTKVGILCLAPENLDSRWLNFEAGALAKTIDNVTFVCPYLIDLDPTDVPLPLGQFQAKRADFEGTKSLVQTINDALGEVALTESQLSDAFETYWPRLKEILDNLPAPEGQTAKRDPISLLEEILSIVRALARERYPDFEYFEDLYDAESNPANARQKGVVVDLMEALRASIATSEKKSPKRRKTPPNPGPQADG